MKRIIALIMVICLTLLTFAACNSKPSIVAEKDSAGEEVAQTLTDYEYTAVYIYRS